MIITCRPNSNDHQTLNLRHETVTTSRVFTQATAMSGQSARNQASHQQNHGGDLQDQQDAREQAPRISQTSTVHQLVAAPKTPSSNEQNKEQGTSSS